MKENLKEMYKTSTTTPEHGFFLFLQAENSNSNAPTGVLAVTKGDSDRVDGRVTLEVC